MINRIIKTNIFEVKFLTLITEPKVKISQIGTFTLNIYIIKFIDINPNINYSCFAKILPIDLNDLTIRDLFAIISRQIIDANTIKLYRSGK